MDRLHYERQTFTDLPNADEVKIVDWWDDPHRQNVSLSGEWKGKTVFEVIPDPTTLPPGYEMVLGRLTKKHASTRPPRVMPDMWNAMTKKQKRDAIAQHNEEKKRRKQIEELKLKLN